MQHVHPWAKAYPKTASPFAMLKMFHVAQQVSSTEGMHIHLVFDGCGHAWLALAYWNSGYATKELSNGLRFRRRPTAHHAALRTLINMQ